MISFVGYLSKKSKISASKYSLTRSTSLVWFQKGNTISKNRSKYALTSQYRDYDRTARAICTALFLLPPNSPYLLSFPPRMLLEDSSEAQYSLSPDIVVIYMTVVCFESVGQRQRNAEVRLDYSFAHPSVNLVNRQPLHPLNFHITEHFECVSRTLVNRTSVIVSSYLPASRAIEQSDVRLIVSELRFNLVLRLVLTDFRSVFKVSKKFSSFFFFSL